MLERQQQESRAEGQPDTLEHLVEHLVGALGEEPCSTSHLRPHFRESEDSGERLLGHSGWAQSGEHMFSQLSSLDPVGKHPALSLPGLVSVELVGL